MASRNTVDLLQKLIEKCQARTFSVMTAIFLELLV